MNVSAFSVKNNTENLNSVFCNIKNLMIATFSFLCSTKTVEKLNISSFVNEQKSLCEKQIFKTSSRESLSFSKVIQKKVIILKKK